MPNTLHVLCNRGDTKTHWNPESEGEVEAARATFTTLRAKGYTAFCVNARGERGDRMDSFDPRAGSIVMVPQLKGG